MGHDLYGISIYSVSFGSSEYTDDETMKKIACVDDCSHFYRSEKGEELAKIYEKIAFGNGKENLSGLSSLEIGEQQDKGHDRRS